MRFAEATIYLGASLLPIALGPPAHAQSTEGERRQACMGDAFSFCATEIPDRDRIRACLLAKRTQISPECRAVLEGNRPALRRG